jgi:chaperone required for assembly of F1-ATPase
MNIRTDLLRFGSTDLLAYDREQIEEMLAQTYLSWLNSRITAVLVVKISR